MLIKPNWADLQMLGFWRKKIKMKETQVLYSLPFISVSGYLILSIRMNYVLPPVLSHPFLSLDRLKCQFSCFPEVEHSDFIA